MSEPVLEIPKGFRASGVKAGIKPSGALDVAVLAAERGASAAGTFTTNRVAAAPVVWCRNLVPSELIRGIVINAGNANAATGAEGFSNAQRTAEFAAAFLGVQPTQVLLASTGVIGHQLPMDKVEYGVEEALASLTTEPSGFLNAAHAIMTTDTRPKIVSFSADLESGRATVLGIAKGAAMIGPNMATMLAFLLTDARVPPGMLQGVLSGVVDETFNCISVEGHTSTNDSVLMLSARGDGPEVKRPDLPAFRDLVLQTCSSLARMIPDDGEGATHLIQIDVEGCLDTDEARRIARAVADSPLVKTAIHGADPNWGRIVSAAGYAGVPFDEPEMSLFLNNFPLYREGSPVPFNEIEVSSHIRRNRETHIRLIFTRGPASTRVWTCDLTAEYIRLNAEYTT